MKKMRSKKQKELSAFTEKILQRVHHNLMKLASCLQRKTQHYSTNKKKFFLLLFCIVFTTESVVILILSLQNTTTFSYSITPIRLIRTIQAPKRATMMYDSGYNRIDKFRHYIDSDKSFRDHLLEARPHLMDTLNFLKDMYKQNDDGK